VKYIGKLEAKACWSSEFWTRFAAQLPKMAMAEFDYFLAVSTCKGKIGLTRETMSKPDAEPELYFNVANM
jgi:hypothetical protein